MREYKSWCVWKKVAKSNGEITKIPFQANGELAKSNDPSTWITFEQALACAPIYDGIGFVLSDNDPYAFIDLDDKHGTNTQEMNDRQLKIFNEFDSYSERSPSRTGCHIIVKGSVPKGCNRASIEIYSDGRFMTMTGDTWAVRPIVERNDLLNQLHQQITAGAKVYNGTHSDINEPQTLTDDEVILKAGNAVNGYKFSKLYAGEWQEFYPHIAAAGQGPSEADMALVNIITFYTKNMDQAERVFYGSALGKRDKYKRRDLVIKMITKSLDNVVPNIDFIGYKDILDKHNQEQIELSLASVAQSVEPAPHKSTDTSSNLVASTIQPPPGLVGEIAQFIHSAAPRPVPEIAIAAAVGLMAGICGRAYNVSGTGLNQYILCLAMTGAGKEAMASGIDKIINEVQKQFPIAVEFIGPSEIASGQALVKYLSNKSQCFVSVLGEFGLRLRSMSSDKANGAEIALRRMLLDLYNKSGYGQVARPSIYADSDKNTNLIMSPSFSILGESTPERFYEVLTEEMISEGLLPRFMMIEYHGKRPALNENAINTNPPEKLISKIAQLMAYAKTNMHERKVINIEFTHEANQILREFDKFADNQINSTDSEILQQLWNRAHIKVLKISGLLAVGIDSHNPIINIEQVMWAKNIVERDITNLSRKFVSGIIGKSSEEIKQIKDMKRMIKYFVTKPFDKIKANCSDERLYTAKIIPGSFLSSRLYSIASFKNDKVGQASAFKRTLQNLLDNDFIREVAKKEMIDKFGCAPRSFMITNMSLLDEDDKN